MVTRTLSELAAELRGEVIGDGGVVDAQQRVAGVEEDGPHRHRPREAHERTRKVKSPSVRWVSTESTRQATL